ncbi:MAG TPA: RNA polymerase sigma-70 factor [Burkholderiaceae bacterium]|nr:RNA polymerase sigma-70 factor [Burkholderiaceae bacterium]
MTNPTTPSTGLAADAASDETFHRLRPRLFGIAYRMLGMRADAEDVVQDAWLRWRDADRTALASAEAWLVTVTTRLAIDRLRAAKVERERYVGWWLPEPLMGDGRETPALEPVDERTPEAVAEWASDLSVAFLFVLERLAPEERAAFLLRQVFDHDYPEIAAMLGKSEAACRQMVHRAAERVRQQRPRFDVPRDTHRRLLEKFVAAAQTGQRDAIKALLADDVELVGDGGGKVAAFRHALHGDDRIANLYWAQFLRLGERVRYRLVTINGEAGVLRYIDGQLESAQAFATDGERILAIYAVRNPDKLAHIAATAQP